MNHSEIVSFLWGVADLIRDPFKGGKYAEVIGFEINSCYFFSRSTPPRPLEEADVDIRALEQEILRMLPEITGGRG